MHHVYLYIDVKNQLLLKPIVCQKYGIKNECVRYRTEQYQSGFRCNFIKRKTYLCEISSHFSFLFILSIIHTVISFQLLLYSLFLFFYFWLCLFSFDFTLFRARAHRPIEFQCNFNEWSSFNEWFHFCN